MSTDDGMGGAADDRMIYTEGVGFGRVLLFIGGLGMLFAPITLTVQHHANGPEWSSRCQEAADTYGDQFNPTIVGCPADPRQEKNP